jgi:transcriptional regulator with XRE-family HTH domain
LPIEASLDPHAPPPSPIGARLRAERQRNELTVRELARRVGVSPSLVSQIERDKVNPSVSTLWGMVTALGLTMGEDSLVRHGGKEYGYVLSGRLGVRIGFDEYELTEGMAISFDSSAPHRLWAVGEQPAEAIWVVVGRQNDARTAV